MPTASSFLGLSLVVALIAACHAAPSRPPTLATTREPEPAPLSPGTPLPKGPLGQALGTEHPVRVGALGLDGSWAVLCQARSDTDGDGEIDVEHVFSSNITRTSGDEYTPYLVMGTGPGHAVSHSMTATPDGRWLAFPGKTGVELVDTIASRVHVLPPLADLPGILVFLGGTLMFSDDGAYLVGRFAWPDESRLDVYRLADGEHWSIDIGDGHLEVVRLDPAGRTIWIDTVREYAQYGSDFIHFHSPPPRFSKLVDTCKLHGDWLFGSAASSLNAVKTRRARLEPGAPLENEPGGLLELSGGILAREPNGALVLRTPSGARPVAAASCGGVVVWSDPQGHSALVACPSDSTLRLVQGDGSTEPLGSGLGSYDENLDRGPALLHVGPGALLQTSTLERVTLSPFDLLEVVEREGVVVKRANVLVHHRLDGDSEGTPLGPTDRWWVTPAVNGRFVAADGLEGRVIELATGAEISRVEGRVHGLSADGQVLVGPKQATAESRLGRGHYRWPKGPLHWQVPSPTPGA